MATRLVLGRDFNDRDVPGAVLTAIVNEAFVRRYLPEGHPLGQQISIERVPARLTMEIVGVVKDAISFSLREPPPPTVYLAYFQHPDTIGAATFEIRARGSVAQTASLVRDELRAKLGPTAAQVQVEPLTEQVERAEAQERLLAALASCFGALALILAAVGLYGLLAYTVARSTSEIGIRMALGVALGIPAAWAGSRLIASMLFGLTATDPLTIFGATLLLGMTALIAAFLPAHRASRVDPMVALRYE